MASIELKIPTVGESITEVEIGGWLKKEGEQVQKDDPVVTLESEKATVELPAPEAGTITKVLKQKGEVAKVGEVIGYLEHDGQGPPAEKTPEAKPAEDKRPRETLEKAPTQPKAAKAPIPEQKAAEPASQQKPESKRPARETAPAESPQAEKAEVRVPL